MNLLEQANQLLSENRLQEAEFHYKSVLETGSHQGEALFGLGRIAMRLEKYPEAVVLLQQACQRLPKVLNPLFALADAFDSLQKGKDAFDILEYCCKIAPHNSHAFYRLGLHLLIYGHLKQAQNAFLKGLNCPISDVTPYLYYELAQLDKKHITTGEIEQLHNLLARTQNLSGQVVLHYTLAKAYHHQGDKNQAMAHYRLANSLQAKRCAPFGSDFKHYIDDIITTFNADFIADHQDPVQASFTPVFIIGMPRSGSTLLERMLCQHQGVASLGENDSISAKVMAFLSAKTKKPFPHCLTGSDEQMRAQARQIYAQEVSKRKLGNAIILNKLPANFQAVGAIKAIFPNAKFIDMRRSFYPMAWSVFTHYFGANEAFFCDMDALTTYYEGYDELMVHWHNAVKGSVTTIHYEQLIEQPEQQLRQLFNWLGLTYTKESLNYHKSRAPVSTLSRHQVRKPLYNDANKAYKEYEQAFKECFSRSVQTSSAHLETDPASPEGV
ncbi:tetratricopeptide repeat-containing sulfotransferase family protein [Pseudoalteromonas sp. SSDWG2]|uniref:tetratricopeptide repeat-containing sulfotransferase family protein n=1 Tax=Pseudoalteromonas sp. SSDWG2 TaxID=3139391 RepID=UPI003BA8E27D